ncbi:hypothetical protein HPP92_023301 [Vanilla planifolia]|uniref:Uncharacterized protein n=1 Tax=Vanilla planifolia TaxID=51239 RepID=A0A835PV23_VANPL|nr:hypothetical protein HPP92_023301 [Vanilla planifolia]
MDTMKRRRNKEARRRQTNANEMISNNMKATREPWRRVRMRRSKFGTIFPKQLKLEREEKSS